MKQKNKGKRKSEISFYYRQRMCIKGFLVWGFRIIRHKMVCALAFVSHYLRIFGDVSLTDTH